MSDRLDPRDFPPVLLAAIGTDLSRYQWFTQSLLATQSYLPPGSHIEFCAGLWIPVALNQLIAKMRPEDSAFCIVPDDHIWHPDLILRLLAHQVPIVMPLCCLRRYPYPPAIFHDLGDQGFKGYHWDELKGQTGLMPIDTGGGPFAVIRREVIEALGQPFFQNMPGSVETPQEDLYTFRRCREAGFQPYVDLSLRIGHCLAAAVFPEQLEDGEYAVRLWSWETLGILCMPPREQVPDVPYHAYT